MKTFLAVALGTVTLLAAGMPLAQDTKAPAAHDNATATATQSGSSTNISSQMDEHMKKMQALHDKMASATTPEERQKIMDEQQKEMQRGMDMIKRMQGGAMMHGMGTGMMDQKGKPADANAHSTMMQMCMDMGQMMLQTVMDLHGMMTSSK